jgi:hypothetical protein
MRGDGGFGPRLALAVSVSVLTGAVAALLAVLTSGSIGPERLSEVGPDAGALALSVGTEVLVGAAILLLLPRRAVGDTGPGASAASPVPDRSTAQVAGLDAWQRLAAEGAFTQPVRSLPATDPWQRPADVPDVPPGRDRDGSPADDGDATEPIPGFERGAADRPDPASPTDPAAAEDERSPGDGDATEPIPGFERGSAPGPEDGSDGDAPHRPERDVDPANGEEPPRR